MIIFSLCPAGELRKSAAGNFGNISSLKPWHENFQCPVVALSQLSQAPEMRADLSYFSDLRESEARAGF